MSGLSTAVVGSVVIATISTFGDFVWATLIPEHRVPFGLAHGALLFMAIGLFFGVLAKRPLAGALGGGAVGAGAAGVFYLLAPLLGYAIMFLVWAAIWLALAFLIHRLLGGPLVLRAVLGRGLAAALGSGVAFYAISGIWRPFDPAGWDYAVHAGAWALAYLPGFAALLAKRDGITAAEIDGA
jgi:hypothetical protein